VPTPKNKYRRFIQVVVCIACHHDHVWDFIRMLITLLAIFCRTFLTTNAGALMTARHELGASLIAREPIARGRARHRACTLMLARPLALLNTWCTRFVTFLGTFVMLAAHLSDMSGLIVRDGF
jgi:hypothetical protein